MQSNTEDTVRVCLAVLRNSMSSVSSKYILNHLYSYKKKKVKLFKASLA